MKWTEYSMSKKSIIAIAALLFASLVPVYACAGLGGTSEYPALKLHYKMTVEVETPEGIKTGAAVREISIAFRPMLLGEGGDKHIRLEKAEAVAVDMGGRGALFATLGAATDTALIFFRAFPSHCPEGDISRCSINYYSSLKPGKKVQLSSLYYPMLVAFEDLNNPLSVKKLIDVSSCDDPKTELKTNSHCIKNDHFKEVFGEGVKLKGIYIEKTDDKFSPRVEKFLRWLPEKYGRQFDGSGIQLLSSKYPVANMLSVGNFSTEVGKK